MAADREAHAGFPARAIEAAFSWWVGRANRKRGKKPFPGDIGERAQIEAGIIAMGRKQVAVYERYGENPPDFLKKR